MIRVIVTGAAGRMGQRIIVLAESEKDLKIVGKVDISDPLEKVISLGDVVIDFSSPDATLPNLRIVEKFKKAAVVGTTGQMRDERDEIEKISHRIPLVMAPNMSVGVNVLWKILAEAARVLGADSDVRVREVHHIHKKDSPSGTALEITRILSGVLKKQAEKIPVESIREGEVVGDHTVAFDGVGETLTLTHHAKSRDTFALGALRAARWIVGKPNGLYSMADVLGLK